jgi:hypothetical protein
MKTALVKKLPGTSKGPDSDAHDAIASGGRIEGVRMGKIVDIDDAGLVRVDFSGNESGPLKAKLCGVVKERLEEQNLSAFSQVLLAFEDSDPTKPIVMDVVATSITALAVGEDVDEAFDPELDIELEQTPDDLTIDGKTLTFDAHERIVLRCGKSSITLTKAGKVVIRGTYLLNRSSGVNRIKGGSVQIN